MKSQSIVVIGTLLAMLGGPFQPANADNAFKYRKIFPPESFSNSPDLVVLSIYVSADDTVPIVSETLLPSEWKLVRTIDATILQISTENLPLVAEAPDLWAELEVDGTILGPRELINPAEPGISVEGFVESRNSGFKFPDATVQMSAGVMPAELSAHQANISAHHSPPDTLPPSGSAGGDLEGAYPNPSVVDNSHDHDDSTVTDNLSINNGSLYAPSGTGNVGIGTTSPVQKLHLEGADGDSYVKFTNAATGATNADGLTVGINTTGDAFIYNRDATFLRMGTANGTQITVHPSGNVGIGTLAPNAKLAVAGTFYASAGNPDAAVSGVNGGSGYGVYGSAKYESGIGVYGFNDQGGYAGYFEGQLKSTGDLVVDGRVGIGVAPGERLSVAGLVHTYSGIKFPDGTIQTTSLNTHATDPSAHHAKTTNASELTSGLLPEERIGDSTIGAANLKDGNVTPAKVSTGFIQDLLGLEVVQSTQTIGNPSDFPTRVGVDVTCPTGKRAIACGFQTDQQRWHVEGAYPNADKCNYSFTTCISESTGGFRCWYAQEPVYLYATCVNESAL